MTTTDERAAGRIALATVIPLVLSLALTGFGPPSRHPHGIATWATSHGTQLRVAAIAWVIAMLGIVVLAIRLRDALLSSFAARWWAGTLFVQGASVFAAVAVVAGATAWAVAELGGAASPDPATVTALWTLHGALLTFACWGLIVPVLTVGRALSSHSLLGQVAAVMGVGLAAVLLVPPLRWLGLSLFAGYLTLTGAALLLHARRAARSRLDDVTATPGPSAADRP